MNIIENKKFSPRFLTGNMIKIIAAILMVVDHIGVVLMHEGGFSVFLEEYLCHFLHL